MIRLPDIRKRHFPVRLSSGAIEKYPNYVEKYLCHRDFFMVFFSTFNVAIT